jgi:hypothetical protein
MYEDLYEGLSKTEPTTFAAKTVAGNFLRGTMPDYEAGGFDTTIQEEVMRRGTAAGVWKRQNAAEHRSVGACVDGPSDARGKMSSLTGGSTATMCPACSRGS